MPTIVGILTFMSGKIFMHEKSFITSGPDNLAATRDSDEMNVLIVCSGPPLGTTLYTFAWPVRFRNISQIQHL